MRADVDVTTELALALLEAQHPDLLELADERLEVAANGWDNVVMRLGDELALRLPRREAAAHLVEHEQAVLPLLAPRLPVPVPAPVRVGRPDPALTYPYAWSVVPWFDGETAARTPVARRTAWAPALGRALAALHVPAPSDVPVNPFRGVPLADRAAGFTERLGRADADSRPVLEGAWAAGLAAPVHDGAAVWLHGDPHPGNVVVGVGAADGEDALAALVDFGDVTGGDPASDLATAWLSFDAAGHDAFRSAYAAAGGTTDEATWTRARACAASLALALLAFPDDHPLMAEVGRHAVERLGAGA
ncbi:phosphotransferase [Luteimicrobium sp. NPDC057192]|uniref:phosphotransferase n=1 Tax=Luteimicrobium sp. NPDC057192 TaxID=3346042 RepID=UPI003638D3CE